MNTSQPNSAEDDTGKLDAFRRALQQARDTIAALVAENTALKQNPAAAVVGMACRFPGGADSLDAFWRLLDEQHDAISEASDSRWPVLDYLSDDRDAPGKMYTSKAGFLHGDMAQFDAGLFGISPKEARALDPQQRLLLEVTWHALEDAGIMPSSLKGSQTGVFVGMSGDDYARLHRHSGALQTIDAFSITGTTMSTAAGRIAYTFGLHGPCLTLDTACSSSLVALHLALQSLRRGECDTAIVAGVNLILMPELHIAFSKLQALSPDGACRTFDALANGYVRSEGCAAIVLKRQTDAIANHDDMAALIKGCAINQDGKTAGLAAPSGQAQRLVIEAALNDAALQANDIDYVEAHGTGTNLGDPIELEALGAALGTGRNRPLLVGSVKSNIGHMEPVAGLGGLIKIALSLRHQKLPANLHFHTPNPHVDWAQLPITVVDKPMTWLKGTKPRLAGLSSFGFSGTNAHVIVSEAEPTNQASTDELLRTPLAPHPNDRGIHVLALSARTDNSLRGLAQAYAKHLEHGTDALADMCFSAHTTREVFDQQLTVAATDRTAMVTAIRACLDAPNALHSFGWRRDKDTSVVWLFTGQGAQYAGMGATLYHTAPVFKQAIDDCAAELNGQLDVPLADLLFAQDDDGKIHQTQYTQPALFALQYALAQLWLSWGVKPSAVVGHSVGEFAAACLAGVFSLADALKLVSARGHLMQALPSGGAMAAIFAAPEFVRQVINTLGTTGAKGTAEIDIACVNHPGETVVSGTDMTVTALLDELSAQGIQSSRLTVSHAFHSMLMTPMLQTFEQVANSITLSRPNIPLISNLTGLPVGNEILTARYWCDHVRDTVRFSNSVGYLLGAGLWTFLEIGPHPVLSGHVKACADHQSTPTQSCAPVTMGALRKGRDDWDMLGHAIVALSKTGVQIDWHSWDQPYSRLRVKLPHYVFDRQRYWQDDGYRRALSQTTTGVSTQSRVSHVDWEDWSGQTSANAQAPGTWLLVGQATNELAQALLAANQQVLGVASLNDPSLLTHALAPELTGIAIVPDDRSTTDLARALSDLTALMSQLRQRATPIPIWVIALSPSFRKTANTVSVSAWRATLKSVNLAQGSQSGGLIECEPEAMGEVVRVLLSGTAEDWLRVNRGHMSVARLQYLTRLPKPLPLNPQATYLITGGLGGLGLALAKALSDEAVAQVLLIGRRAPDAKQAAAIQAMAGRSTSIATLTCDVSDPEDMATLKHTLDALDPPLKGVFHLAGVMPLATEGSISADDFSAALAGKLDGARALHHASADCALDLFVLFGSISAVTGTAGIAAYAAANASLEQITQERRELGLPALCVHWGPWHEGSMMDEQSRQLTKQSGFRLLPTEIGFGQLWSLLNTEVSEAVVVDANWDQVKSVFDVKRTQPLLTHLASDDIDQAQDELTTPGKPSGQPAFVQTLLSLSRQQQTHELSRSLGATLAGVLSLPPGRMPDASQGFFDMGMDSLTAFEFREAIQELTGLGITTPIVFDYPTIDAMTGYLLDQLQPAGGSQLSTNPRRAPSLNDATGVSQTIDVAHLSDDEIARLIEQEFDPSDGTGGRS